VIQQNDIGLFFPDRGEGFADRGRRAKVLKILTAGQYFGQPFENDRLRFAGEYGDTAQVVCAFGL